MDAWYVITVFVALEELYQQFGDPVRYRPRLIPSEIMTVAVMAAQYFNNNHERALVIMQQIGYFGTRRLSVSRYNRQLHQLADFLDFALDQLVEVGRFGEAFILDSMPLPVCKRKRARRCRKVRGRIYCGYCAAKDEKFFGWRLHLVCNQHGFPVAFEVLPASLHDLTPVHEITAELPKEIPAFGDKAYNSEPDELTLAESGAPLIPIRKVNMKPHDWATEYDLEYYRKMPKLRPHDTYTRTKSMSGKRLCCVTWQRCSVRTTKLKPR